MSRRRMAGDADYTGRLNAAGSYLLDQIKGTGSKYQNYREIEEAFPEQVNIENADNVLLNLAPRTGVNIEGNTITGGDAILDNQGRVNIDKIPFDSKELSHTAPDAVNSDADPLMRAMLNPDDVDLQANPGLARAVGIGRAMAANDTDAYQRAGSPIDVTDEAARYLAGMFTKGGKTAKPLRSSSFTKVGGIGSDSRSQILIPDTDTRFIDASKQEQGDYLDQRTIDLTKQWLQQGGASIGNPRATIVPPGVNSHMDHVRSLSSSTDTIGAEGWGYSDSKPNFSWLDAEANVHAKLNYSLQGQHRMMRLADEMRKQGRSFPARLSQSQLGDPNRARLSDEGGAIRLVTDKADGVTEAGENLLMLMNMVPDYA